MVMESGFAHVFILLYRCHRRNAMQYWDRPLCGAFDGENIKAAEQFAVAQRE